MTRPNTRSWPSTPTFCRRPRWLPLIRCNDKPGFVVADMVELDDFAPIPSVVLPDTPPALWISNGTGRDGTANRNAPKVGWCWAGNRHTWLGFASAARREPLAAVPKLF